MTEDDVDFADVFATVFGMDATGGTDEIVTVQTRPAGDEEGQDGDDVELWGHACFAHRPADPTDEGKCQVMTMRIGARKVAIASRDLRASKTFGAMNPGDSVFGSPTGGTCLRCNGDGSTQLRHADADGAPDAYYAIEKDGALVLQNEWGQIVLDASGFHVIMASGETISLGNGAFSASATTGALQCGAVALCVGASIPLAPAPITGTAGAGFCATAPILGVTVAG